MGLVLSIPNAFTPVRVKDVVGVLQLINKNSAPFDESDEQMLGANRLFLSLLPDGHVTLAPAQTPS